MLLFMCLAHLRPPPPTGFLLRHTAQPAGRGLSCITAVSFGGLEASSSSHAMGQPHLTERSQAGGGLRSEGAGAACGGQKPQRQGPARQGSARGSIAMSASMDEVSPKAADCHHSAATKEHCSGGREFFCGGSWVYRM